MKINMIVTVLYKNKGDQKHIIVYQIMKICVISELGGLSQPKGADLHAPEFQVCSYLHSPDSWDANFGDDAI